MKALKNGHTPRYEHCGYLCNLIEMDKLEDSVKKVSLILRNYDFDAIAFRGMSGALIAPAVALKLDKTLLMVRKPRAGNEDDSHSYEHVEGDAAARRYVILDDFIATGRTIKAITEEIKRFAPTAICIGAIEVSRLQPVGVATIRASTETGFFPPNAYHVNDYEQYPTLLCNVEDY